MPGLAREIIDQWKGETAHRHNTIDGLRATDHEAMRLFHEGERRGQRYALAAIVLMLAVVGSPRYCSTALRSGLRVSSLVAEHSYGRCGGAATHLTTHSSRPPI